MEQNSSDITPESTQADETAAAPRRRASRRVSTATAAPEATDSSAQPASDAAAPAAETATEAQAEAPKKRTTRTRKKAADADDAGAASAEASTSAEVQAPAETPSAAADAEQAAPKKRTTRTRKKAADTDAAPAADATQAADGADQNAEQVSNESAAQSAATTGDAASAAPKRTSRSRKSQAAKAAESADAADASSGEQQAEQSASSAPAETETAAAQSDGDESSADDAGKGKSGRGGRGKNGKQNSGQNQNQNQNQGRDAKQGDKSSDQSEKGERNEKSGGDKNGGDRNGSDRGDKGGDAARSTRTRQRDRKRRGQGDDFEPELSDDDVLLPVGGILDVLDNYAFVRTSGYLPGTSDVYVSLGQVKKYGLRKGDAVTGSIRQPREGDGNGRQKYNAIVKVDTVNGRSAEEQQARGDFAELTPLYPEDRVRLETTRDQTSTRVLDVVAPIGFGQRALISGPSGAGKSTLVRDIAAAISANHPDAHLMLVATSERPEEVTHLQRTINGEVIASTFDRPTEDHTTVAELAVERAKRLVELGHDVIVLLESVTDVARAYADAVPTGGRNANDDPEGVATLQVKRLLSAARNLENAGSLTIIATADTKTGNPADKALVKALLPVVNSTVRLSGDAAAAWIFPAIDVARTYTERESLLRGDADAAKVQQLRRSLSGSSTEDAIRGLVERVEATATNADLIARA